MKWSDGNYNCHYLQFRGFIVSVCWDGTSSKSKEAGYKVSFENRVLIKRFQGLEEGKAAGIALAKRTLEKALAQLTDFSGGLNAT